MTVLTLSSIARSFGPRGAEARALDGVDLTLRTGETVALVGESGSGKTTLARIAIGLDRPDAGRVHLDEKPLADRRGRIDHATRARLQMVFQDPLASFNPHRSVAASVELPLRLHGRMGRAERQARVRELLSAVGLDADLCARAPAALSGGQLQRAAIARALATEPELLICDEPVASLDVSVRAQVLNLLARLRRDRRLGILFVSHDLGVVQRIADRTLVLYLGRVVEEGVGPGLWRTARHPYTRALAAAVPDPVVPWRERPQAAAPAATAGAEIAGPFALPSGCRYRLRCPFALQACAETDPTLEPTATPGHRVACLRADDPALAPSRS